MRQISEILIRIDSYKKCIDATEYTIRDLENKNQFGQAEIFIKANDALKEVVKELEWVMGQEEV